MKKVLFASLVMSIMLVSPVSVMAQDGVVGDILEQIGVPSPAPSSPNVGTPAPGPKASGIDTPEEVMGLLESITNWMFTIFIALAVIMVLYTAFIYLTSGGGEETSRAHKMLLYAAIAVAVATLSRGIVRLVEKFVS